MVGCKWSELRTALEVDLPLLWIAAEPLLTLFSRELRTIDAWNSEVWGVKGSVGLLSR